MDDRDSTTRSRELGDGLRAAMTRAGLDGRGAALALGWSQSRVSRLLSGKRTAPDVDIASFLAICGVIGGERDHFLHLARQLDATGWLQRHGHRLPKQLRTLIHHEQQAAIYCDFQPIIVPGLLQTPEYARALIREAGAVPDDEVDDRVTARLARQDIIEHDRQGQFSFYVHEFALRLPVGDPATMSMQLHHLLRVSVRPYVTLRVIPAAHGTHAGIAGHFILMEFHEFQPVAYLESETSCLFLEDRDEISAYRGIRARLATAALDEGQSRELVARLATELYPEGEPADDITRFWNA